MANIGRLESNRPLIVVRAQKSCIVNRQIGVGDSKNVIVFDSLLTGHVIRRMLSGRVRIFNGNHHSTTDRRGGKVDHVTRHV